VRDPVQTVERIYAAVDDELDGAARDAVSRYAAAHPKGLRGAHQYDLSAFGLDAATLRERFAGYIDRYGIAPETAALASS
jgi:anti-sigma factor RsiW